MPLVDQASTMPYLSFIPKEPMKTIKKSFASSKQGKSQRPKKGAWVGYDLDTLPELSVKQLATIRKVSTKRHKVLKEAVEKQIGRPKKDLREKENIVAIRFSEHFLEKLKKLASKDGFPAWQTYAKKILSEYVEARK